MSADTFAEYLEKLDFCELPETILLQVRIKNIFFIYEQLKTKLRSSQKWGVVARRLVESSLAIRRYGHAQFSRFRIETDAQRLCEEDPRRPDLDHDDWEIRLFYYAPLMNIVHTYFAKNIPGEFWLELSQTEDSESRPKRLPFLDDPSVQEGLAAAAKSMEEVLQSLWKGLCSSIASKTCVDRRQTEQFLWLLEEWLCARRLMAGDDETEQELSLALPGDLDHFNRLLPILQEYIPQSGQTVVLCVK